MCNAPTGRWLAGSLRLAARETSAKWAPVIMGTVALTEPLKVCQSVFQIADFHSHSHHLCVQQRSYIANFGEKFQTFLFTCKRKNLVINKREIFLVGENPTELLCFEILALNSVPQNLF